VASTPATADNFTQTVSAATGGTPIFSNSLVSVDPWPPVLRLSPDGTQIATSAWGNPDNGAFRELLPMQTEIFKSGVMASSLPGWPVGWTDNTHLIVNNYVKGAEGAAYGGCTVYDLSGIATGTCALPEVTGFQMLNSDTLYALIKPEMVSISTGTVSWMSGDPLPYFVPLSTVFKVGPFFTALAGNHVVLVSDSRVVVQSF
jgi:hypothetical protein